MPELKAFIFDMDGTVLVWKDPAISFEQMALIQFAPSTSSCSAKDMTL